MASIFTHKDYRIFWLIAFVLPFASFAQKADYSPAYFGPNANPVPSFPNARIPQATTIESSSNHHFGWGDYTRNLMLSAEIPLLPQRVSFKTWVPLFERYKVTQAIYDKRNMEGGKLTGKANGDFYVQTKISILTETHWRPSIILNSTLKTASGTKFKQRRYFDTPGYYFDSEIGKSIYFENKFLREVRGVVDFGFLCWETTNSTQNDAPMYGGKLILSNDLFDFENTLSGYKGWMNNGDRPLVYAVKLTLKQPSFNSFIRYEYGIKDFPYHSIQVGTSFVLPTLTPKY